jgi:methyltransferase-like protein
VNGLQYLGEADFSMMVSTNFPPAVAKTLHDLGAHDLVQMEQYMDFVRCRYFRKSLVCRGAVRLNRTLRPEVVKGFWLASDAAPAGKLDLTPGVAQTFARPGGDSVSCKSPLTKLALTALARHWPQSVPFETLAAESARECTAAGHPPEPGSAERFLGGEMLTCMATGAVEWRLAPAQFTTAVSERPVATPLARLEADGGYRVTTLRGESVSLDEFHRQALRLLDGTRSRAQIGEALMAKFASGELVLQREADGSPVREEREMRSLLATALDKALANLARRALLRA